MEVRALCIRLLLTASMLLVAHVQRSYPQTSDVCIVPSRLQLFEYESVSFSCQGLNVSAGWRVRNIKNRTSCLMSTVTCTNNYTLVSDSGEYWCEGAGGERSNTVTITVTGGSVILESPVLPVMEGESVSLRCRTRKNVSDLTANFYKDGLLIGNSSTGNITIESVSRSDDGLYKCNIPGAGESPQSQLMVTVRNPGNNDSVKQDEDELMPQTSPPTFSVEDSPSFQASRLLRQHCYILLWILVTVVLVLQLLVIGLLYRKKQLVLLEVQLSDPNKDIYAVVNKKKKKMCKKDSADAADGSSVCLETDHSTKPQTERDEVELMPFHSTLTVDDSPPALQDEPDEEAMYSSIQ